MTAKVGWLCSLEHDHRHLVLLVYDDGRLLSVQVTKQPSGVVSSWCMNAVRDALFYIRCIVVFPGWY